MRKNPEALRRSAWLLYAVWLCFVVRGFFYCTAFPIFEGFDEYVHFGVLQRVFFHHEIPNPRAADYAREIAESQKPTSSMVGAR